MAIGFRPRILSEKASPRRRHIYEGRSKVLFEGPEPGTYVLYFKDNHHKKSDLAVTGKGVINNRLSELLMLRLGEIGIETHFIRRLNMREQLVRAAEVLPFDVVMHNVATGDFAKRLGLDEGMMLPEPIPELDVRTKGLLDSVISARHITGLGWADTDEVETLLNITQRINDFLCGQFLALGIRLMRYSLSFGRVYLSDFMGDTQIILIDEITPDNCHLLDLKTGERLDLNKDLAEDVYDEQKATKIYQEIARRFGLLDAGGPPDLLTISL
jgi:phosphoribosylaminoimidazole-succinocarboxamide synthase